MTSGEPWFERRSIHTTVSAPAGVPAMRGLRSLVLPLQSLTFRRGRPEREPLVGEFFLALDVTGQELKLSQIEPDTARTLVGG